MTFHKIEEVDHGSISSLILLWYSQLFYSLSIKFNYNGSLWTTQYNILSEVIVILVFSSCSNLLKFLISLAMLIHKVALS